MMSEQKRKLSDMKAGKEFRAWRLSATQLNILAFCYISTQTETAVCKRELW